MDLSKQSRQMLDFAAEADTAPLPARHRGRNRLVSGLAAGALTTSAVVAKGAALGASASVGASATIAATLVSAVVIGFSTGLVVLSPSARNTEKPAIHWVAPRVKNASVHAVETKALVVETPVKASPVTPPHEPLPAVSAPSKPIKASIARETELLGAVQRALKVGRPSAALDALERYTEECPTGLLYEEATASRVVALCAVGRVQDGRRWADEFARRYPNSPLAPRVRGACPSVSAADASNGPVNE